MAKKSRSATYQNRDGTFTKEFFDLIAALDSGELTGSKIVTVTQAEYDALPVKETDTYYFIKEN